MVHDRFCCSIGGFCVQGATYVCCIARNGCKLIEDSRQKALERILNITFYVVIMASIILSHTGYDDPADGTIPFSLDYHSFSHLFAFMIGSVQVPSIWR
jgi:hypothetical protein